MGWAQEGVRGRGRLGLGFGLGKVRVWSRGRARGKAHRLVDVIAALPTQTAYEHIVRLALG